MGTAPQRFADIFSEHANVGSLAASRVDLQARTVQPGHIKCVHRDGPRNAIERAGVAGSLRAIKPLDMLQGGVGAEARRLVEQKNAVDAARMSWIAHERP